MRLRDSHAEIHQEAMDSRSIQRDGSRPSSSQLGRSVRSYQSDKDAACLRRFGRLADHRMLTRRFAELREHAGHYGGWGSGPGSMIRRGCNPLAAFSVGIIRRMLCKGSRRVGHIPSQNNRRLSFRRALRRYLDRGINTTRIAESPRKVHENRQPSGRRSVGRELLPDPFAI